MIAGLVLSSVTSWVDAGWSLKVQVLRSFEASHSVAMAGVGTSSAMKSRRPPVVPVSGCETN